MKTWDFFILSFAAFLGRVMEQVEAAARQETHFLETLRGIHSVKAFGQEQNRFARWQQLLGGELNAGITLARFQVSLPDFSGRAYCFGENGQMLSRLGFAACFQTRSCWGCPSPNVPMVPISCRITFGSSRFMRRFVICWA